MDYKVLAIDASEAKARKIRTLDDYKKLQPGRLELI
jgi:hypothetical protein